ncbi:MAG: hypothetical protein HOV83_24200 [Catenulispora sp.]|nr:hypothetical protein [Catenulispora sp.]
MAAVLPVMFTAACSSSSGTSADPGPFATGQSAATTAAAPGARTSAASAECEPTYVMTFCEHITVTGAVTVSGTASAIPETDFHNTTATCATWVGHKPQSQDYPQLRAPQAQVGGHTLQAEWKLPYEAGTVHIDRRNDSADDPHGLVEAAQLMVDNVNYRVSDSASTEHMSQATSTMTINADGSGSITFEKMINVDSRQTISGSITWACVDSK